MRPDDCSMWPRPAPRSELHLLGTALIKVPKNGTRELSPGDKRSLLGIAWPALKDDFESAYGTQGSTAPLPPQRVEVVLPQERPAIRLRRLPADWQPPADIQAPDGLKENAEIIERPRGSLAARAFGTVVHGLLEDVARLPGIASGGVSQVLFDEVATWRARALAMLRSTGLPSAEAETNAAEVVRALHAVLRDPTGRWILGSRAGAKNEVSVVELGRGNGADAAWGSHLSRGRHAGLRR